MYLNSIHSLDKRWPTGDSDCQDFLHKILIYTKLKPYIEKIGKKTFKRVYRKFNCLQSYGIDYDEIFSMNLTLIRR